jgi:non-ribosomal peptide synthetase component F
MRMTDLSEAAGTTTLADPPFHVVIERQARQQPTATALVSGAGRMTFGELNARANRLAHYLRDLGVGPDVLVAICLERGTEMISAMLAVLKAGGAYLPLDPGSPAARLEGILDAAQPVAVVTHAHGMRRPNDFRTRIVTVEDLDRRLTGYPDNDPDASIGPENLAYVIYTSGSTGAPKGVAVTHRGLSNYIRWGLSVVPADAVRGSIVHSALYFGVDAAESQDLREQPAQHLLARVADRPPRLVRLVRAW